MNSTLEQVKREAYAHGLQSIRPLVPWTATDEFSRAYQEAWLEGALAATQPPSIPAPNTLDRIVARYM